MQPWDERLMLLTPKEYEELPDGTTLHCINGETRIKGVDTIDMDTRFGHIAYGFLRDE